MIVTKSSVEISLNFWCFNSGIAFEEIKKSVRSIILTSGTLSPIESFHSELAVPFHIKLEVDNYINASQVRVDCKLVFLSLIIIIELFILVMGWITQCRPDVTFFKCLFSKH